MFFPKTGRIRIDFANHFIQEQVSIEFITHIQVYFGPVTGAQNQAFMCLPGLMNGRKYLTLLSLREDKRLSFRQRRIMKTDSIGN
jgi:hypothetical protein